MRGKREKTAQTLSEYVILISLVVAAIAAMFPFVKRGTQSLIKSAADQIADQRDADQKFDKEDGYMLGSNTVMSAVMNDEVRRTPHYTNYIVDEHTTMRVESASNLGFTNEEDQ